jgi:hypothetical protein
MACSDCVPHLLSGLSPTSQLCQQAMALLAPKCISIPEAPEQRARKTIDAMLTASGWTVQTRDEISLAASHGVAIGELTLKSLTVAKVCDLRLGSPHPSPFSKRTVRRTVRELKSVRPPLHLPP